MRALLAMSFLVVAAACIRAESVHSPPAAWAGSEAKSEAGYEAKGPSGATWRAMQIWPGRPLIASSYIPLVWGGRSWVAAEHSHGGQPSLECKDGDVTLSSRNPWPGQPGEKLAALVFEATSAGRYTVFASIEAHAWDDGLPAWLRVIRLRPRSDDRRETGTDLRWIELVGLRSRAKETINDLTVDLAVNDRLVFVPKLPRGFRAANITLRDLRVARTDTPSRDLSP